MLVYELARYGVLAHTQLTRPSSSVWVPCWLLQVEFGWIAQDYVDVCVVNVADKQVTFDTYRMLCTPDSFDCNCW